MSYCSVQYPGAEGSEDPETAGAVVPVIPWRWHDLDISVKPLADNMTLVEWAIDGNQVYAAEVDWSNVAFQIQCSVENLDKMGDMDPVTKAGTYFNSVKHVPR